MAPPDDRDDDAIARPFSAPIPQRLVLALVAWPPIGLAAGFFVGEVTGCGRASATCGDVESALGWLVQPLVVVLLALLPVLARPSAIASIALGVAAIGGAVVLAPLGGVNPNAAGVPRIFVAILVMAWAVGLIGAVTGRLPLPAWLNRSD